MTFKDNKTITYLYFDARNFVVKNWSSKISSYFSSRKANQHLMGDDAATRQLQSSTGSK